MSISTQVANAVVAELKKNMQKFSIQFEPAMLVLPNFESSELQTIRVTVVPRTLEIERNSRNSAKYIVGIDIGIQRRIENTPEETVENLGNLVDEIILFLKSTNLSEFHSAQVSSIANDPIYSPEHLQQKRIFTSVLNVKYVLFD
ncbi:MAG: hypothetical protein LBB88_11020 [Planctomycetaceae bacterium]|jgi:hypothetical protein|nr:hypothetical protein [Planctomycetaceae bacterium]